MISAAGAAVSLVLTLLRSEVVGIGVALADGLFASAVLLLSVFGILWAGSRGAFDVFAYSFSAIASVLRSGISSGSDYAAYKSGKARRTAPRELLASGLIYLLAALSVSALFAV